MDKIKNNEMRSFAHISLVISVTLFSMLLSVLDLSMGWEIWVVPLFFVAAVICLVLHITGSLTDELRLYIYSTILFVELFYYIAKISVIYDSTPVILFILILLTTVHEKKLIWICCAVVCFGMAFRVALSYESIDAFIGLRIVLNLLLVFITAFMLTKMLSTFKSAESSVMDRIDELEAENKSAGDFLANVSHEIRTPINAVIGLTGVCIEKEKDEDIRKDLHSISDAGIRISEQISDILDYSEIDMDKLAVHKSDYTMSSLLNDLVSELKLYKRPDIELVIDVDPTLPAVMNTDTSKLKKILWHIIVNGLKYTKEGGVYVHITYTRQSYGLNLCVDVTDTGIGMTEEELERLFERFYQSDSGRTRNSSGLGLGMSIVHGFVRSLGGFITVESKVQSGTSVHVSIPQGIVSDAECMSVKDKESKLIGTFFKYSKFRNPNVREYYDTVIRNIAVGMKLNVHRIDSMEDLKTLMRNKQFTHLMVGEEEYGSNIGEMERLSKELIIIVVCDEGFVLPRYSQAVLLKKPIYCFPLVNIINTENDKLRERPKHMYLDGVRALVVDDEPMNLTVASGILNRYKMSVDTVLSGQEAIDLCKVKKYDIIFMDHMMPLMDGVETARRIRLEAGLNRQDTAFVALTANAVSTAREMFMTEGFDGFVSKPIVISELERVLKSVFPASSISYGGGEDDESGGFSSAEAENTKVSKDDMELLGEGGVSVSQGLAFCMGDKDLYREVLIEYARDEKKKTRELKEFYDDKDWDNYKIRIHALKSSSKTIGADRLSKSAEMLETAAKDHNEAAIDELYPEFTAQYKKMTSLIKQVYDGEDFDLPEDETDEVQL